MHVPFYTLPLVGVFCEGVLLWVLLKDRLFSRYPYFTGCVLYDFIRCFILFAVTRFWWQSYSLIYWNTEIISLFLRFLIIWEVVRSLFPRNSILRRLAWKLLVSAELALLPLILMLSFSQSSSIHYFDTYLSPALEQYLSLAQAILLLVPAAAAHYYGISLGRNMRGLIFGFGAYLSVCAANFAGLQAWRWFSPVWRLLSPATYIGMIGIWLWAFRDYAPAIGVVGAQPDDRLDWLEEWHHRWVLTMRLLGRGLGQ
jgi:hypothetical protein